MEKHVVSLEIAKKLKKAGWIKQTRFVLYRKKGWHADTREEMCLNDFEWYPTPLATEILEELPRYIEREQNSCVFEVRTTNEKFYAAYYHPHLYCEQGGVTLPDTLALMWLHLKKNNLLKVEAEKE